MTWRDMREIARWALVTAVAAVCIAEGTAAICNATAVKAPAPPKATLAGLDYTGTVEPSVNPNEVTVTVEATNPSTKWQTLDVDVVLERRQFAGDVMSRVVLPNDYKVDTVTTKRLAWMLKGSSSKQFTVNLPLTGTAGAAEPSVASAVRGPKDDALKLAGLMRPPTYVVKLTHAGKEISLATYVPRQPGS